MNKNGKKINAKIIIKKKLKCKKYNKIKCKILMQKKNELPNLLLKHIVALTIKKSRLYMVYTLYF